MNNSNEKTVIIVGAGLTGIASSYYLSRAGIDHLLIEKKDDLGGIWSSLSWPGIRCDTEIINYSYSFKPYKSRQCLVSGESISNYLHAVAEEFGILDKILFSTKVLRASFHTNENKWHVYTNQGIYKSRFLVNANGYFSDIPHVPQYEGSGQFQGEIAHLFDLDGTSRVEGKRVILIGSGASAISTAPILCESAKSVTLIQRSPSYVFEQDNDIGLSIDIAQTLHDRGVELPIKIVNYFIQLKYDLVFVCFRLFPWIGRLFFKQHWKNVVKKEDYDEVFRPSYNPWEQRIPVAIGLKEKIRRREIEIVTGNVERFVRSGVLLGDGRKIESDLCILATGFTLKFFRFDLFTDDQRVETAGINFYKGMMMGGIPNYFQPFGPPHTSFTRRIEMACRLIARIVCHMRRHALSTVMVQRRRIDKAPRITPGYVMRNLSSLPVIYGSLQIPSIDNFFCFRFRRREYCFSNESEKASVPGHEAPKSERSAGD
jgi:monooxygenase